MKSISPRYPGSYAHFVSTGCYIGYLPLAPGTVASLIAALFYFYFLFNLSAVIIILVILITLLLGILFSDIVERADNRKDPGYIVIDEIVGMWISLIALPRTITAFAIAFVLFRFFDVFKPFPIRKSQELEFGLGVMIDDVLAGIYTLVLTHIVVAFI